MQCRQSSMGRFFAVVLVAAIGCGLGGCGTGLDGEVLPETIGDTVADGGATRTTTPTDEAEGEPREAVQGPATAPTDGGTTGETPSPETAPTDTTPPKVTTVSPATDNVDVATDVVIRLTWSEAIDPATVTAASVSVVTLADRRGATPPVAGTWATAESLVTFTPAESLTLGRQYTIVVTTDVRDFAGNALAEEFRSSFTTTTAFQGNALVHPAD